MPAEPETRIEVLVLPRIGRARLARALAELDWAADSLVAVAVAEHPPHVLAMRLFDEAGQPAPVELGPVASRLSAGGVPVGRAVVEPARDLRRWESWKVGECVETIDIGEETWVPRDPEGFPDFETPPVRAADGVPPGWRRLRSCLDLGMERLFSCRFVPVAHQFERLRSGEATDARAFVLRTEGRAVRPPAEIAWEELFRS